MNLLTETEAVIKQTDLIRPDDHVLTGVSGDLIQWLLSVFCSVCRLLFLLNYMLFIYIMVSGMKLMMTKNLF